MGAAEAVRASMGAAAAMSAHIYGGSSVIRIIIRNPPWRSGDPQGIPTPPHPSLEWGSNRDPYPTPHPTPPHASIPFGDPHANPKRKDDSREKRVLIINNKI